MSILIRLILVSFFLMMASTAVSLADPGVDPYRAPVPTILSGQGQSHQHDGIRLGPVEPERQAATQPQHAIKGTPSLQPLALGPNAIIHGPVDLKLLVISADGLETDFPAITTFLNQIGIPYATLIASQQTLVPSMLWDGVSHGYYQGILLCTGNLGIGGVSAFDDTEWAALWEYEGLFGIRQATLYTYPSGYPDNYGLYLVGQLDTSVTPLQTQLTSAGQQVFSYLNATTPITIEESWTYLATVISPTVTTPLLVSGEYAIASVTKYPDGRQNLAVTAANNSDLMHSMLLSYGIINWVTNGLFLGERHVNLDAQLDDMLIEDDIWDTDALTDTTGILFRMTRNDLNAVTEWQTNRRASPNASSLRLEWTFNGEGGEPDYYPGDTLTQAVVDLQGQFNWVNHTYSHANLDAISYISATTELSQNHTVATNQLSLTHYFRDTMVQPDVSGLTNTNFLQAASDFGIRYLIADTSQPGWNNPSPNAGFYTSTLLIIPRRPMNLFYNVSTPAQWVSEYNYFYGPGGLWPYWDHDLSYSEILDKESDVWLDYLLKWDLDPLMFHQSNTRAYSGNQSLLGDLIDATLNKYNRRYYNLPVRNLSEHEVGINMANRMAYNTSGVRASILPCSLITLTTTTSPTLVPVTGIAYGPNHEVYGGQNISYIQLDANQTLVLPYLPPCQTISFGLLANKTYGDPPFTITATASSGLTVTFTAGGPCLVGTSTLSGTVSLATTTITGTGSCTITATQPGNVNFNPALPVSQTFTITKANQVIGFGPLADKTYGDPPFAITATASSGLTVTFTAGGPCLVGTSTLSGTMSLATTTITGTGSCTITATQPGNVNFNPALPVSQTFTITQANQAISFGPLADKTYGDPPFAITATASSNLTVTFAAAGPCLAGESTFDGISSSATVTITGAGNCAITASQPGNADYNPAPSVSQTFTITKANQAISFGPLADKTYLDPPFAITATASSNLTVTFAAAGPCLVGESTFSSISSSATVTITGAGSCAITASQLGNADYNPALPVSQTFTITKANQAINFDTLADKTYGDPPFAITATASSGLRVSFAAEGSCMVGDSTLDGISSSATVTITGASSCTLTANQPGDANFDPASTVFQTLTIVKANQAINFGPLADKMYADPPFTITATASSELTVTFTAAGPCLVGTSTLSETVSLATTTLTGTGSCTIMAGQAGNANFNPAPPVSQTFTISRANQAISFGPLADMTYLDPPLTITATTSSNLAVSFAAAGSCLVGETTFEGISSSATVTIAGAGSCAITASQLGNADYNPALPASQTFTITKANQAISFGPLADKTYLDPPFTITATTSSNLAVSFAATGSCLVGESTFSSISSSATVTITGAGSCAITANQPGDANFNPAPSAIQTFTISRANQAINFDTLADKMRSDPPFVITAAASSNLTVTFAAVGPCLVGESTFDGISSSATVTITGAGSCTITASQSGNTDYYPALSVSRTFTIKLYFVFLPSISRNSTTHSQTAIPYLPDVLKQAN
jgi:hypothetical protein